MDTNNYPALYQCADEASLSAQGNHTRLFVAHFLLLMIGAGLSVVGIKSRLSAAIAAIFFILAIGVSIFLELRQFIDAWYRTRAIAESVKTSTWLFMMRAEPFGNGLARVDAEHCLSQVISKILSEHKHFAAELASGLSGGEQITQHMRDVRQKNLTERKAIYSQERIREQQKWYTKKCTTNKLHGKIWFGILIACQVLAAVLVILRIVYPEHDIWPTELFVVAAGACVSWMQLKRFKELAASYSVAAHEISLVAAEAANIGSEAEFDKFVGNAENAFSREHTQWVARKDKP